MATTQISITLNTPAGITIAQATDTLSAYWGYSATLPNGDPNPQTKAQFVKATVARFVRESYVSAKANQDAETARQSAITTASQVTVD